VSLFSIMHKSSHCTNDFPRCRLQKDLNAVTGKAIKFNQHVFYFLKILVAAIQGIHVPANYTQTTPQIFLQLEKATTDFG